MGDPCHFQESGDIVDQGGQGNAQNANSGPSIGTQGSAEKDSTVFKDHIYILSGQKYEKMGKMVHLGEFSNRSV